MESLVDAMAAAYDALVDAAARSVREPGSAAAPEELKRCVDAFHESCDRAEVLVQDAAASFGPLPPAAHALCRTAGAGGDKEEEMKEKKDPSPPPPEVPVAVDEEK